ncbi:permease [Desulforudis sp. 1088]|uniref:permease n=2 Tax=Candidatus Desulforudis TaxID=471826 RepID=UPI003CE4AEBC
MFNVTLFVLTIAVLVYSYRKDMNKSRQALKIAQKQFLNIFPGMLGIIGLIGLMLALVPREIIQSLFGNDSLVGILLISAVGSITLMPAFIAFPLASSLLEAGASVTAVACFITTLLMVGTLTAPLEAQYFGKKFTILRNGFGLLFALIIGFTMGAVLR